jgi:hypothetical protein
MELKKQLIKREIAGDFILVPVGDTVSSTTGLFILNELGAFIWDLLPQVDTEEQLLEAVLREYDADPAEARGDIAEFLAELRKLQIL